MLQAAEYGQIYWDKATNQSKIYKIFNDVSLHFTINFTAV